MRYVLPSAHLGLANQLRHLGDVDDFDNYRLHLPEQWCPMVTIIAFVISRTDNAPEAVERRHFTSNRPSMKP